MIPLAGVSIETEGFLSLGKSVGITGEFSVLFFAIPDTLAFTLNGPDDVGDELRGVVDVMMGVRLPWLGLRVWGDWELEEGEWKEETEEE